MVVECAWVWGTVGRVVGMLKRSTVGRHVSVTVVSLHAGDSYLTDAIYLELFLKQYYSVKIYFFCCCGIHFHSLQNNRCLPVK